ncbi:MAG: hypothetical protein WA785_04070, partial [Candidatus Acidiferrales bacterium]
CSIARRWEFASVAAHIGGVGAVVPAGREKLRPEECDPIHKQSGSSAQKVRATSTFQAIKTQAEANRP